LINNNIRVTKNGVKLLNISGKILNNSNYNYTGINKEIIELLNFTIASSKSDDKVQYCNLLLEIEYSEKLDGEINYSKGANFNLGVQEYSWLLSNKKSKWIDYLIYRYKFRMNPKKLKLESFPPYVLIEPTSICNIRCVMCFQVDKSFTKKEYMGRMPWDIFTKAVDEVAENNCQAITLASRGEPTLHPQLGEMLLYIKNKGILDLKLNTNATKLNEKLSRNILEAEVKELVFSVDAGTKETYESIRVKGKFEEVVNNIKNFNKIRKNEFPNSKTTTRISGVKVNNNQDINQMTDFWERYVDQVSIKSAIPRWDTYNNKINNITKPCEQLWERIYIWYDGTINPCDFDYKSKLAVGNINNTTIKEAWHNLSYKNLRKNHMNNNRSLSNPCDRCPL
jgi:radical SAM protein with 4Fe4S-binding SPASM domain